MEAWSARERFVTQKSAERRKSKSPHRSWERAENKNNKTPCRRKKTNKINQKLSESSVETTTFIFPLQLCTIRLYTSKAVMLSSQHSECGCVLVCVLGGAALGEVRVEDGCRNGDHHCDDRHPGAPAALLERYDNTHARKRREKKKIKLVQIVMCELDSNWIKTETREEKKERRWRSGRKDDCRKRKSSF